MTDTTHLVLEREASEARARLMATLDVLDVRARNVVQDASRSARSTALGLAGAVALGLTFAFAERTQRRTHRPSRSTPKRSILGDAMRAGAVAFVFVSVSTWSKYASQPTAAGHAISLMRGVSPQCCPRCWAEARVPAHCELAQPMLC